MVFHGVVKFIQDKNIEITMFPAPLAIYHHYSVWFHELGAK